MNDQRMVDVGFLEELCIEFDSYCAESAKRYANEIRAIISGPGVEPVLTLHAVAQLPEASRERLIRELKVLRFPMPLYLSAPSAPVQAVPDWQPIDTAPDDVEVFIGRFIDGEFKFGRSMRFYYYGNEMEGEFFHGYVWSIDDVSESIAEEPTHWMPLPQQPKESTAQSVACPTDKEKPA